MTALRKTRRGVGTLGPDHADPAAAKEQRVRTTTVTWQGRADLSREEWQKAGLKLGGVSRSTSWWVGDWVRFGRRYGDDRYRFASRVTGYDEKTLRNFAYVAGRYDQRRRRSNLTWSHHAELARLKPNDQERWLDEAEARKLTITALRESVRRSDAASAAAPLVKADGHDDANAADDTPRLLCPHCQVPLVLVRGALMAVPISGQADDEHEQTQ